MSAPSRALTRVDAGRLLGAYHFTPAGIADVAHRLGCIQYDPLNPMGRNPDLTLQSRVPDYRVDGWQELAYRDRALYDAWDKQACLVPLTDWPHRRLYHRSMRHRWQGRIFDAHPDAVAATLAELGARGPLETSEFADQRSVGDWRESWYGPKLVKNVLRALWDSGEVVTYGRRAGRHIYALPEAVVPSELLTAPDPPRAESLGFLIRRRVQSAGLLRARADAALWNLPCDRSERVEVVAGLLDSGSLEAVAVDGERFLTTPEVLLSLDAPAPSGARFVAPLDPLVWDRKGVEHLYGFTYLWEVYKPQAQRRWGYYVLPVWWRDRFVGRFDARVERGRLNLLSWWWEDDVQPSSELLDDLGAAFRDFAAYLGGVEIALPRSRTRVPEDVRAAVRSGG